MYLCNLVRLVRSPPFCQHPLPYADCPQRELGCGTVDERDYPHHCNGPGCGKMFRSEVMLGTHMVMSLLSASDALLMQMV